MATRRYGLYGLSLKSDVPLPCPRLAASGDSTEMVAASGSFFARARREQGRRHDGTHWFQCARLQDGGTYLRWSGLFEFHISSDGRRIKYHALNGASRESLQTYLLSQVLSSALVKQGVEHLHATAVVINDRAVAFVGDCGYGKSSLGAAFLKAGHRLLTDDVLVIRNPGPEDSRFLAYPGPPRIKLFPGIARRIWGNHEDGVPMNPLTPKLVIPLSAQSSTRSPCPLRAIYVLRPPAAGTARTGVTLRRLRPRQAFWHLTANIFNALEVEPARLARQFAWATQLAAGVPVKFLSYPHDLSHLPSVLAAIQNDLSR